MYRNLFYLDKPFALRMLLSLMEYLRGNICGFGGYHLFTDRYYSSVNLAKEWNGNFTQRITRRDDDPKPGETGDLEEDEK